MLEVPNHLRIHMMQAAKGIEVPLPDTTVTIQLANLGSKLFCCD